MNLDPYNPLIPTLTLYLSYPYRSPTQGPLFSMTSAAVAAAKEESRKISFDDFLKALRRALPTKSDRSHNKLAKALSLEVKASRGVDFESVLGISDPSQVNINAIVGCAKRPQPPSSGSGAPVTSKYLEPEAPRYITASNGYVRKNSKFIDLLHLQVCSYHTRYSRVHL